MGDNESKGFKVVDKRGMSDAEREAAAPTPQPPPPRSPEEPGNPAPPPGVGKEKSPGTRPAGIGGPTFLDLVMTLQMGAMVHLGMIQVAEGKRSPVNLPAAKDSIDILEILQGKTKGNLTEEEARFLENLLLDLRLRYVQRTTGKGA